MVVILTDFLLCMVVGVGAADQDGHDSGKHENSVHAGQWSTHIAGENSAFIPATYVTACVLWSCYAPSVGQRRALIFCTNDICHLCGVYNLRSRKTHSRSMATTVTWFNGQRLFHPAPQNIFMRQNYMSIFVVEEKLSIYIQVKQPPLQD